MIDTCTPEAGTVDAAISTLVTALAAAPFEPTTQPTHVPTPEDRRDQLGSPPQFGR